MPFPVYAFAELGASPPIESKLHAEIVVAGPYTTNFLGVKVNYVAATVEVVFDAPPSGANQATVSGVIAAHDGVGVPMPQAAFQLVFPFAAGGGGAPDDVPIYTADAPYSFRITDAFVYVSTVVALSTLQLRDAAGGGGNALSDAWASAVAGIQRNALLTATPVVPTAGTLVLRRSDSGVAGEVVVQIERIG